MSQSFSWMAYVGSRTTQERHAQGRGLSVYGVGSEGEWTLLQCCENLRNPSYLCLHPWLPKLYVVHGDFSEVSTFLLGNGGEVTHVSECASLGLNPVHLALSPSARWLLVVNYASGNVATLEVNADGDLCQAAHVLALSGTPGPDPQQRGSHPHQAVWTPDGRFVLVPDKGLDKVFVLNLDEAHGQLHVVATLSTPPGSGPRHLVCHPRLPLVYLVGELSRSVMTLHRDVTSGQLVLVATNPSVPEDCTDGASAGIVLSSDARRLYVSNRGHDSVANFALDEHGVLNAVTWIPAGSTPRFITIPTEGGPLLVARENGHSIATLDNSSASFTDLVQTGSPVCIVFKKENP